jgi:LAO/AO transport system kinase
LARAITLVESTRPSHRREAAELLQLVAEPTEPALRLGISGVPGVGKSTFIEAFGLRLVELGHRVAVLAVDPSSVRTGGSILADKTRMTYLSRSPSAFIRPSPTSGTLGGVARRTRESIALVEGAGYDVVLVETVGVGQSESSVAMMVDTFLLLLLAGAGDDIQGIKRGILEFADVIAFTKADGDNATRARAAASELRSAVGVFVPPDADWTPPVRLTSSRTGEGLDQLWADVSAHRELCRRTGRFDAWRAEQRVHWLRSALEETLIDELHRDPHVAALVPQIERAVAAGRLSPSLGAEKLLAARGRPS